MPFRDLGKFTATFCRLKHGQGFRLATTARSFEEINRRMEVAGIDPHDREKAAGVFFAYPWQEHFTVEVLPITWDDNDLPGYPRARTPCSVCHEPVMDGRHLTRDGQDLCRLCAASSSRGSGA
ncbi:MAG: formylmethanofuran dehydrogenase, subunit E region [Candidatus Ozemobacter sibiricus]|uniref:Formylmethanofuran dehydrogenase, subunit E region n=1 Tax=Candidatus Ozemobacter sibiricus TaxID=2268124 RepID=A0A367ZSE3_9BACT|nr:MAG: formylmethanofuran dehydrogenase, subunit E region [Candidatus Ozemobacter sibiricus]